MGLKILQLNSQRSSSVAPDVRANLKQDVDVLMLQEPYSYRGIVKGYSSGNARIIQPKAGAPQAAIIVLNSSYDVTQLVIDNCDHVVCARSLRSHLMTSFFLFQHTFNFRMR